MTMTVLEDVLAQAHSSDHLRPLDMRHDLMPVADLIELCFAQTMDADGQEYLRQMRRAAHDAAFLHFSPVGAEAVSPLAGFVWVEDDRVVGNLSLIPFSKYGRRVYLIANVAVHPTYRGRGIGTALTAAALHHIDQRRAWEAWLQVRDDNPSAYHIYRSLGFEDRARRTTWQTVPPLPGDHSIRRTQPNVSVSARHPSEWSIQRAWLENLYPPEVAWNLPLHPSEFAPGLLRDLKNLLNGHSTRHWSAHVNGARASQLLLGVLTWEPSRTQADSLWLAASPAQGDEDLAVRALLPAALKTLAPHRAVALNYPAGHAEQTLHDLGFTAHQTLVWMSVTFKT